MRAHFVFIHFVRNNVVGGWCGGDGVNDFFLGDVKCEGRYSCPPVLGLVQTVFRHKSLKIPVS